MSKPQKLMSLPEAIERFVPDGAVLFMGGFIQAEPFAAAHEIIRQGKKNLTLTKCSGMMLIPACRGRGDQTTDYGLLLELVAGPGPLLCPGNNPRDPPPDRNRRMVYIRLELSLYGRRHGLTLCSLQNYVGFGI